MVISSFLCYFGVDFSETDTRLAECTAIAMTTPPPKSPQKTQSNASSKKAYSVWQHILLMLLASVGIIALTLIWMNLFTRHGQEVEIPDIQGLSVSQAEELLDKADLEYEIIDSIYTADAAPGAVLDVVPHIGSKVKKGRIVFLTIKATSPRQEAIPVLLDVSERQALATLRSIGFEHITPSYVPGAFDGLVQGVQTLSGQPLEPGRRVPLTTPLVLVVSVGIHDSLGIDPVVLGDDSLLHDLPQTDSIHTTAPSTTELPDDESWF